MGWFAPLLSDTPIAQPEAARVTERSATTRTKLIGGAPVAVTGDFRPARRSRPLAFLAGSDAAAPVPRRHASPPTRPTNGAAMQATRSPRGFTFGGSSARSDRGRFKSLSARTRSGPILLSHEDGARCTSLE